MSFEQIQNVYIVILIGAGGVSLFTIWTAFQILYAHRHQIAWRYAWRRVGMIPTLLTLAALVGLTMLIESDVMPFVMWIGDARVVETVIPLAIGLQAAFLFSPDDEPTLELVIAAPRPLGILIAERLMILVFIQGAIALFTTVLLMTENPITLIDALIRSFPPSVLLAASGIYFTLRVRSGTFGLIIVGFMWAASAWITAPFTPGVIWPEPFDTLQPWLWAFHPYMQPSQLPDTAYLINRGMVLLIGLGLLTLSLSELRNSEKILSKS
ncbi:MAG: hypothetical protein MUF87_03035 [Anaerolineae bacterium]|jgi:hypothetical protein|nr:hypothetical protein [Anaerolineae bacterium]